jgi:hypothetical protein
LTTGQDLGIAQTPDDEFERQLTTLLEKGYPDLAGLTEQQFRELVEPLRSLLAGLPQASRPDAIPFVVVVTAAIVPTFAAVEKFEVNGKVGFTHMRDELPAFRPIDGLVLPDAPVYLLTDVSTGADTLNVRPDDALPMLREQHRTPLTTDEGVAIVTQFPVVFSARNAFQALGSRAGNKRIPSFWISKGAPRLGWCWAGNPHTWLGAGSAQARLAAS